MIFYQSDEIVIVMGCLSPTGYSHVHMIHNYVILVTTYVFLMLLCGTALKFRDNLCTHNAF